MLLDPFSRAAIVTLSALCVAGAFALAPIRARGSIEETPLRPVTLTASGVVGTITVAPITRDPFAEPASPAPTPGEPVPAGGAPIAPLPGNLTNDAIPALPGSLSDGAGHTARVTAVVTGAHPYAMVESDGINVIKGIGDRVAGQPISAIGIDGVRLANGELLIVAAPQ